MLRVKSLQAFFSGKKTLLYDFHIANKAKMVEFAGYSMPVQYPLGIIKEHEQCRASASLFDVSHMGQIFIAGNDRLRLLERTTVGTVQRKHKDDLYQCYLTLFLNEEAGIIDDAIICVQDNQERIKIIVNAANKYTIMEHFIHVSRKELYDVKIKLQQKLGLIALQGPKAAQTLQKFVKGFDLSQAPFMSTFSAIINETEHMISRSGYTGEDGFQISGNEEQINWLAQNLIKEDCVELAGLGARDSLRVQAGLCLHGHQISQFRNPFESNLMWTVHKRQPNDPRFSFIGETTLQNVIDDHKAGVKTHRKRAGFILDGPGIVREDCRIYNSHDQEIGIVTSGTYSPSFKKGIGMAYIKPGFNAIGNQLYAVQRDKKYGIRVQKLPFLRPKYYKSWNALIG